MVNVFNLKEKFEFLEDGIDFPFYNNIPKLSTWEWAILVVGVILFWAIISVPSFFPEYRPFLYFLVTVVPALYVCKGNYSIFFKKVRARDIKTIILCLIGYVIYSAIIILVLYLVGAPATDDAALKAGASKAIYFIGLVLQLFGEEFFKISLLLIVMYLVYNFTDNRNLAIRIGIFITLLLFGLAHLSAYGNLLQVVLLQGFGSIFDLYAYMKTKNVFVSYIFHLAVDLFGSLHVLMG